MKEKTTIQYEFNTNEKLSYRLISNIFIDNELINSCINEAKTHVSSQKNVQNSSLLEARVARLIAFNKFNIAVNDGNINLCNDNIISVMKELENVANSNNPKDDENIIPLQLTAILEDFISSLTEQEISVYIQRYFLISSVAAISKKLNITSGNVNEILDKCNDKLVDILQNKKYHVKKETLFNALTDIGDNYIAVCINPRNFKATLSQKERSSNEKQGSSLLWPITACGMAILVIIFLLWAFRDNNSSPITNNGTSNNDKNNTVAMNNTPPENFAHIFNTVSGQSYVIVDELLSYSNDVTNRFGNQAIITVDNLTSTYVEHRLKDKDVLKYCIGDKIEYYNNDSYSFHYLLGHDDMQYLIRKCDNIYNLYTLVSVKPHQDVATSETGNDYDITYSDYLKQLHGIENAHDIVKVESIPTEYAFNGIPSPTTINTTITDSSEIEALYATLRKSKFTTTTLWSGEINGGNIPVSLRKTSVLLKFTTIDNITLCNLYYDTSSKTFFTENGTALTSVSEDVHLHLRDILKWPYDGYYAKKWDPEVDYLKPRAEYDKNSVNVYFSHSRNLMDGLYISDWFKIQRQDGLTWVDVKAKNPLYKDLCDPFAFCIYNFSSGQGSFNLEDTYGTLADGKYRIVTSVTYKYTYNTDKHVEHLYYAEFEVKNSQNEQ